MTDTADTTKPKAPRKPAKKAAAKAKAPRKALPAVQTPAEPAEPVLVHGDSHVCCDDCWWSANAHATTDGGITMRLPDRRDVDPADPMGGWWQCCLCGRMTTARIVVNAIGAERMPFCPDQRDPGLPAYRVPEGDPVPPPGADSLEHVTPEVVSLGQCACETPVPIDIVLGSGERVATLCKTCGQALP